MIRKYKKSLILSSIVTLLPIPAALLLWDQMPNLFALWDDTAATGLRKLLYASIVPLTMLAAQWLCCFITDKDLKNKDQHPIAVKMVLWVIPFLSLFVSGVFYALAMGKEFSMLSVMCLAFGLMFLVMGNYMPKVRQNHTIGIKTRLTFSSEANWNATHRFAGKSFCIGGMVTMLCALLPDVPGMVLFFLTILGSAFAPMIYSWQFHKKQLAQGIAPEVQPPSEMDKKAQNFVKILTPLLVIGISVLLFTGNIEYTLENDRLTVDSTFSGTVTVDLTDIDEVVYQPEGVDGTRVAGFGSPKLLLGTFKNDAYGLHSRYTYTKCPSAIVLRSGNKILVLSAEDATATQALFQELLSHIK